MTIEEFCSRQEHKSISVGSFVYLSLCNGWIRCYLRIKVFFWCSSRIVRVASSTKECELTEYFVLKV